MKAFISIVFAFTILFSNIGLNKSTHFCGGIAVLSEFNLGGKQLSCGMQSTESSSCSNEFHFISKKKCCENENVKLSVEDEYKESLFAKINWFNSELRTVFIIVHQNIIQALEPDCKDVFRLLKDIPIWNQCFLI